MSTNSDELDIFAGLDEIDWSNLHHAYGPASDTPAALRALLADDPKTRSDALEHLNASILHQGRSYEATSYAVPFLLKMAETSDVPDRQKIFDFVRIMATEYSERMPMVQEELRNAQHWADKDKQFIVDWLIALQAVYAELLTGYSIYVQLMADPDSCIQKIAIQLLAELGEKWPETEAVFLRALTETKTPIQKSLLVSALATLWVNHTGGVPVVNKPLTHSDQNLLLEFMTDPTEAPDVRFAAAVEAVRLFGEEVINQAIPVLFHGLAFCSNRSLKVDRETRRLLRQFSSTMLVIGQQAIPNKRMQILGQLGTGNTESRWSTIYTAYSYVSSSLNDAQSRAALNWYIASSQAKDSRLRIEAASEMKRLAEVWRWVPPIIAPRLIEMLDDVDALVKFQAAESLFELGPTVELVLINQELIQPIKNKQVIREILKRIRSQEPAFSARVLDPPVLDWPITQLIDVFRARLSSNNFRSKPPLTQIAFTLGQYGIKGQAAIPILRIALQCADDWVRAEAARALCLISSDADDLRHARSALRAMITTGKNNMAKLDAARYLAQFSPDDISLVVENLREWLNTEGVTFPNELCDVLWQLDHTQSEFIVERLLTIRPQNEFGIYGLKWFDLKLLAKMGGAAHLTLPTIRQIINSDRRIYHGGGRPEIDIAADEALLQAARQALSEIEAAPA